MYRHIKTINTITNVLLAGTVLSFGFVSASVIKQKLMPSSEPEVVIERIDEKSQLASNDTADATLPEPQPVEEEPQETDPQESSSADADTTTDETNIEDASKNDGFPLAAQRMDTIDENLLSSLSEIEDDITQNTINNIMQKQEAEAPLEADAESSEETTLASVLNQQSDDETTNDLLPLTEENPQQQEEASNLTADAGNKQVDDVLDVDTSSLAAGYTLSSDYIALPGNYEQILPVPVQENTSAMSNSGYVVLSELTRASILAGYCVTANGHEGFALNLQKLVGRDSFTKHEQELMEHETIGEPILEKYDQIIAKNYPTVQSQKQLCQAALDAEIVVRSFIPGI